MANRQTNRKFVSSSPSRQEVIRYPTWLIASCCSIPIGVESERCGRNIIIVHKDMQRQAHAQKVLGRLGTVNVVQIQLQELDLWCSNIGILGLDLLFGLLDGLYRALLTATGGNNMGTVASEGYHSSIAEFGVNASDQGDLRNEARILSLE